MKTDRIGIPEIIVLSTVKFFFLISMETRLADDKFPDQSD
jgi:hypothetical protein